MSQSYPIPAQAVRVEQEIKRSRFITDIGHAVTKDEALSFIERIRQTQPEARHHCWAYIAGHPAASVERGCSDDGEPQGTAGKPMLNVLQHKGVGEIVVVVSRYFGGIKLGAGGLVRAYSGSVQNAFESLLLTRRIATVSATIRLPFALESQIRHLMDSFNIEIHQSCYQECVELEIDLEIGSEQLIEEAITNISSGMATLHLPDKQV